jgi:ABC-type polysaccharide transport system, permease component
MDNTLTIKRSNNNKNVIKTKIPRKSTLLVDIKRDRNLYIMLIPGFLFFILFKYLPMAGLVISFKDYMPFLGIMKSPWVGLKHFQRFLSDPDFAKLFINTIVLAVYNIVFFFPLPIIISLMLNEVTNQRYKKLIQTTVYIPHFISWIVVVGITQTLLSNDTGVVNEITRMLGGDTVNFLTSKGWFRPLITMQVIWKETGWGTIIFLAALAGVNVELYEAAFMDGANRWQQLWNVTFPAIKSTIIVMLILRMGSFLDSGFEQIWLMQNSLNRDVSEVFDTYVYTNGLINGQFSYSTAVGFFKSIISLILVLATNFLAKKVGEEGVY